MPALMGYNWDASMEAARQAMEQQLADPQYVAMVLETEGPEALAKIQETLAKYHPNSTVQYANQVPVGYVMGDAQTVTIDQLLLPENSSATQTVKGYIPQAATASYDTATKTFTLTPYTVAQGLYTALNVANQAYIGTTVACALGKTIDSVLYNANPDFWDSNGMSAINPETWASLTVGETGLGATLFNTLFGIDPTTQEAQMYVPQDLFTTIAQWLNERGVLAQNTHVKPSTLIFNTSDYFQNDTLRFYYGHRFTTSDIYSTTYKYYTIWMVNDVDINIIFMATPTQYELRKYTALMYSDSPFSWRAGSNRAASGSAADSRGDASAYTYNGQVVYWAQISPVWSSSASLWPALYGINLATVNQLPSYANIAWSALYGAQQGGIEGVGTQDGATLPDTSTWIDPASTLQSLQNQYPDLWNNSATYPVYNPNTGTTTNHVYLPVPTPYPSTTTDPLNDTKPTTQGQTQTQTKVNTDTLEQLKQYIADLMLKPTPTDSTPTGDGSSPAPTPITGSASALWSVYNPTQAQVDALGAWLWSSNFLDVIAKMWQDPMQGIISLHKIFMTPTTGAAQNIQVGYLDSGVSALTIPDQYGSKSCGHVSLTEYYGNVFDYNPYTDVQLYLPFVGVVRLDVGDVMRSDISVNYRVDWYTGAMLAEVIVSRDGNEVMLYQYPTNGAVRYPLSQGTNAALMGVVVGGAVGAIGGALTGGAFGAATMGIQGAAKGLSANLHPDISHGGSLSGNVGALGIKTPYLIVNRPMPYMPDGYQNLIGNPDYNVTTLGNMSGFVRCQAMHIENIPCTDTEMGMIHSALLEGVLV